MMTLFVEYSDQWGGTQLSDTDSIAFVVAHEAGHLLGLPHHPSSLHLMHNPTDDDNEWYDGQADYGLNVPAISQDGTLDTTILPTDAGITQLRAEYDAVVERLFSGDGTVEDLNQLLEIVELLFDMVG